MDAFDAIGLLLPALEKVGDKVVGYDDRIRKKFNRALQTALKANDELYIQKVEIHMPELVGLIVLVMDEPSSINTIPLPNYINRDEFRNFFDETKTDKDLCQVLNDEWNQFKAKDTNNIVKKLYQLIVKQTGNIDEVKGLVEKLICIVKELNDKVVEIPDEGGRKSETYKIDGYNQLYKCLDEKLHDKRENHPSFQLMKIDDRLFPNAQTKQKHIKLEALDSNDKLKTVRDIIKESWGKGEKNHLMIEGDGGIGKTVTLLSIPDAEKFAPHYVPAIYIPLHELYNGEDPIEHYVKKKILKNKENLYQQLLDLIDQPWDRGPRLLLLLDGFNEISPDQREPIGKDIVYWSEFSGIQIITSSRYDIHTYVALGDNYSALKLQALSDTTVKEFLKSKDIPIPTNEAVKKLITTPLMLTLYAMTECVKEERECDAADFREVRNAGSIVWNYLQCELWNFGKEGKNAKNAIVAMEFIAPYMAWQMQQNTLFRLSKKEFHDFLKEAYQLLEKHFDKTEEFPFHISDAIQTSNGIPPLDLIRSLVENKLCLFVKNGNEYRLMHQQFRDALAAMHLINSSYLSGGRLPEEWESPIDYYVMQFVVDLIGEDEATRLWEQSRNTKQAIDDATRNQLRLQGLLHNNDFSHLDFSGLDLSNISIYSYRYGKATIKLPTKRERMEKTKLSDKTFSPEGHKDTVNAVAVTSDGKRIVSGSDDRTIRVWDLETGDPIGKPIIGHEDCVTALAVIPGSEHIVSGSNDETIRVWDLATGALIGKPVEGHESWVTAVAVTQDGKRIVSGSWDKTIRIWNLETSEQIGRPMKGHKDGVLDVALTLDYKRIVSGSEDRTIRIWDIDTGKPIGKPIKRQKCGVVTVAVTLNGQCIVSGFDDNTIRIWDLNTGKQIGEPIRGHKDWVTAIAVTQDGKRIVSGSRDCTIRVWDLETHAPKGKPIEGHKDWVTAVAVSQDGRRIVSGSRDCTIRVWDMETGDSIGKPIERQRWSITSVIVTLDGKHIVSRSVDNTLCIWNIDTGMLMGKPIEKYEDFTRAFAVTPDGKRIVIGSDDHTIRIWDIQTGALIGRPIQGHEKRVRAVAVTPDGKSIVSVSDDHTIRVWDIETGASIGEPIEEHESVVSSVMVTPNGKRIVSRFDDGNIGVWNIETGTRIGKTIQGLKDWVESVAVTPDGKRIICGSNDRTIRVWDIETGEKIGEIIDGFKSLVYVCAVTSDGKRIVSWSNDHTIRVWDIETGEPIGEPFKEPEYRIGTLAVTSNGKHIVSCASNGTLWITNIETREVKKTKIHPLSFVGLDFSLADISDPELKETLRQNGAKV